MSTSVKVWDKGEGGHVAQSLVHDFLLPEDIHVFADETNESFGRRLQWHTIAVISCPLVLYLLLLTHSFSYLSFLFYQATQLTHVLDGRLKELSEDAEWEKALKEVVMVTAKEKTKDVKTAEKKAVASEKARALAEKRTMELKAKPGEIKLKLAEAVSLNIAQAEELADLKATLEACENKLYNEGFANMENFVESVI